MKKIYISLTAVMLLTLILFFTNLTAAPLPRSSPEINLPPQLQVNESDQHQINLYLPDYITDADNTYAELEVQIEGEIWQNEAGTISIDEDDSLHINFYPEVNLDFHIDNSIAFVISADDGSNYTEESYSYAYNPIYKALYGSRLFDIYFGGEVTDFEVVTLNGFNDIISTTDSTFLTFYEPDSCPKVKITHPEYYPSLRYIDSSVNEDIEQEFGLVDSLYDPDYEGDYREDGFTRVFRRGGGLNAAHSRWLNETIWCIHDQGNYGYNPGPADLAKVNTSLSFVYNFTNGFMNPFDGEHLIVDDTGFCDPANNDEYGYTTVHWDSGLPSHGAHGETFTSNGVTIIKAAMIIRDGNIAQSTYNQEALQTLGATRDIDWAFINLFGDYWPPGYSTFCDEIPNCINPESGPTWLDIAWGRRAYQRYPGNMRPDTDGRIYYDYDNAYTEVREYETTSMRGKEVRLSSLTGYAPANQPLQSRDEVVLQLPHEAKLIRYQMEDIDITPEDWRQQQQKQTLCFKCTPRKLESNLHKNHLNLNWQILQPATYMVSGNRDMQTKTLDLTHCTIYVSKDGGQFRVLDRVKDTHYKYNLPEPGLYRYYVTATYNNNLLSKHSNLIEVGYNHPLPLRYEELCPRSIPRLSHTREGNTIRLDWRVMPSDFKTRNGETVFLNYEHSRLFLQKGNGKLELMAEPQETNFTYELAEEGKYRFRVKAVYSTDLITPASNYVTVKKKPQYEEGAVPQRLSLQQNFPNPFYNNTTIKYALPRESRVRLEIYNVKGKKVETLINKNKTPGFYNYTLSSKDLPTGIYFYRLSTKDKVLTKKMIIMKE